VNKGDTNIHSANAVNSLSGLQKLLAFQGVWGVALLRVPELGFHASYHPPREKSIFVGWALLFWQPALLGRASGHLTVKAAYHGGCVW
jgi:hypothetical protein